MKKCQRVFLAAVMLMLMMAVSANAVQRLVLLEHQTNTS